MDIWGYALFAVGLAVVAPFLAPLMSLLGACFTLVLSLFLAPLGRIFGQRKAAGLSAEAAGAVASGMVIGWIYFQGAELDGKFFGVNPVLLVLLSIVQLLSAHVFEEKLGGSPFEGGFFASKYYVILVGCSASLSAFLLIQRTW